MFGSVPVPTSSALILSLHLKMAAERPLLACLCLLQGAASGRGQLWDLGGAPQPFLHVHGTLSSPCPLPDHMVPEPAGFAPLLLSLS